MSILSERLKELRGQSSQREMAEAIGIKYQAWARYESGEVAPGAEILANICRAHAVSADWLLGIERGGNTVIASGKNSVAISGHNNSVGLGESAACSKCPYKKKLMKLEKLLK